MIALTSVKSSNIAAQGYDPVSQVLAIRFTGGSDKIYHYKSVPPEVAEEFAKADSIGRAFASMIRGKFEHQVVLEEDVAESKAEA